MNCAQRGCEIRVDALMEAGEVPTHCPTCGHPMQFILSRQEVGDLMGLEVPNPAETPDDHPEQE